MGKLIAGGDSFIYGNELKDCIFSGKTIVSQSTYPALISKELNLDYVCAARPGFANSSIRRTVMDVCENSENIELVIVQWTFVGRYEFKFKFDTGIESGWEQISAWSIIDDTTEIEKNFQNDNPIVLQHHINQLKNQKDNGISDFAKIFYKRVGCNEFWEFYSSLLEIVMLQQFLKLKNIPYLFVSADQYVLENYKKNYGPPISTLIKQIDFNSWYWFPEDKGFYTWAKAMKFPFGTTHPLEEAHIEAAHLVYEYLRYIGRLS